jgi:hypothetical protein
MYFISSFTETRGFMSPRRTAVLTGVVATAGAAGTDGLEEHDAVAAAMQKAVQAATRLTREADGVIWLSDMLPDDRHGQLAAAAVE